jgi:hypothetical protein
MKTKIGIWMSDRGDLLIAYITDKSKFCETETNYYSSEPDYWHHCFKDLMFMEAHCGYKFVGYL